MASPGVLLRPVPRGVSLGLDTGPRAAGAGRAELLGQAVPVPWARCPQPSARPTAGRGRAEGVWLCPGSLHPLPVSQGPPSPALEASSGKRAGPTCQSAGTWAPDARMNILEG